MLKDRISNNAKHITDSFIQAEAVSDRFPTTSQMIVLLYPALLEKVAAAQAKWIFMLAKSDMPLRSVIHFTACLVIVKWQNDFQ